MIGCLVDCFVWMVNMVGCLVGQMIGCLGCPVDRFGWFVGSLFLSQVKEKQEQQTGKV